MSLATEWDMAKPVKSLDSDWDSAKPIVPSAPVQRTNTGSYAPPAPSVDTPATSSGQKLPFQGGGWKDWLKSAINAPIDAPQALAKEAKPVLQQGLNNINNTLGLQPITDTLNDAGDYKERKAQLENLDFRYRDLWTLAKSVVGNEQAQAEVQQKREELDLDLANMFKQLGADSVQINEKGEMRVAKDGKYYELDDSLFDTLKEGAWASRGEVAASVGGGFAGGYLANLINKDPRKKGLSMVLGGIMGDASSSMLGRTIDMLRNAAATRKELTGMDILDAATDAGAGSAIFGTGITTLGAAVAKPTKAIAGRVGDKIIQGNIGGAEQYAKEAGESLDKANDLLARQSQHEEIQQPWFSAVNNKRQDRLAALAQTNPSLANELATEIGDNPIVADGVRKNIDARARAVYAQLEKSASTPEQIRANIEGYIDGVSKQYEQTKEVLTEIAPEKTFDIQSSGIIEQIRGFEDLIGNVDSKNEVIALANRLTKKGKMGIDDLIEARQEINYILSKQRRYVGKEAINGIKDTIDTAIDDILSKTTAPEETKTALRKSIDDYRVMKEMTEGSAYNDIMKDTLTPEQFDQKIAHHAQTISKTLEQVTSKLKPEEKAGAEMRIIFGLVQKATTDNGGFKAIDFPKLAQAIKGAEFATPEAREMANGLAHMGDLFMQDIKLFTASMNATAGKPSQGISWNPIIRARTMMANQFMNTVSAFFPGFGKSAAFRKHVGQSMTKSRTPMEFFQRIAEHPDAPESLLDKLRPIAKEMAEQRKAIEQERIQAEQLAKEERLAKEVAEKQALEEEVASFKTPSKEELSAVDALTPDDRYQSFSQMVIRIKDGSASKADIERYIKAKRKIGDEKIAQAIKKKQSTTILSSSEADYFEKHKSKVMELSGKQTEGRGLSNADIQRNMDSEDEVNALYRKRFEGGTKTEKGYYDEATAKRALEGDEEAIKEVIDGLKQAEAEGFNLSPKVQKTSVNDDTPLMFTNPSHMGVGAFTGTANAADDYENKTPEQMAMDFLKGFLGGTVASKGASIGAKTLAKKSPKVDEFLRNLIKPDESGGVKVPMFVAAKPDAQGNYPKGSFSDIPSKKAMYEIDDSKSVFNTDMLDELYERLGNTKAWNVKKPKVAEGEYKSFFLREILEHEELYKKYPQLKEMDVIIENNPNNSNKGSFNGQYIELNMANIGANKGTLLHEIQHAIQKHDDLPRGGSVEKFEQMKMSDNYNKNALAEKLEKLEREFEVDAEIILRNNDTKTIQMADEWSKANDYDDIFVDEKDKITSYLMDNSKLFKDMYKRHSDLVAYASEPSYSKYKRLHGEQYARSTSDRMNMTPEERMRESVYDTLKRTEGKVDEPIIEYHDGVSMSINSNAPIDKKIDYLQKETQKVFKQLKNPTQDEKDMYALIMGMKNMIGIQKEDTFGVVQVLVERGYQRHEKGSGLKHFVFRHYGDGAEGELSTREILRIGKTIRDGKLSKETPKGIGDIDKKYKNIRVYSRGVGNDNNLYVVIGEDNKGMQNVITYYSNREHLANNLSKAPIGTQDNLATSGTASSGTVTSKILPQKNTKNQDKLSTKELFQKLGL